MALPVQTDCKAEQLTSRTIKESSACQDIRKRLASLFTLFPGICTFTVLLLLLISAVCLEARTGLVFILSPSIAFKPLV